MSENVKARITQLNVETGDERLVSEAMQLIRKQGVFFHYFGTEDSQDVQDQMITEINTIRRSQIELNLKSENVSAALMQKGRVAMIQGLLTQQNNHSEISFPASEIITYYSNNNNR